MRQRETERDREIRDHKKKNYYPYTMYMQMSRSLDICSVYELRREKQWSSDFPRNRFFTVHTLSLIQQTHNVATTSSIFYDF